MAQARKDELRRALIDRAEAVIAAQGLGALRARDLAEAAGCAVGAIYTAFPDLDALVLEVNRRTLVLFEAAVAAEEGDPAAALVRLGLAYLGFARAHLQRWRALFQHRLAADRTVPDWYVAEQGRLFHHIERPLRALRPDLSGEARELLARSLFSATHGLVSLGLDEKLMALPDGVLEDQVRLVVGALARGLGGAGAG